MGNTAIQPTNTGSGSDNPNVSTDSNENAYVGPQPFPPKRHLYGRDRELLALTNRLLSERLVLFYSPSGAGKTSLIRAKGGLCDRMTVEGLHPLPVMRVSQAAEIAVRMGVNRYLLSAFVSLELARPESDRRTAETLAQLLRPAEEGRPRLSFQEYLTELTPTADKGAHVQTFLVFDQFEELLTLDPTDDEAKREFLRQVGTALRDGDRWALFAMREDYVGALDPFLPLLPTRLAVTFRLDLLRREAAGEAICRPAAEFGVTFEDAAVTNLVHELARIQVQDPLTGKSEPKDGLYVEPLHLQLVCQRLWKERAVSDRITAEDLDRLGHDATEDVRGVAAALAHYYDDSVQAVTAQFASQGVAERSIRNWFSESLISASGLRLPVLLGNEEAFGLSGAVLKALGDRWLIRSEQRHGAIYYELAHDRLVEPVQKSNAAWRKRLAPFQQAAEVWKESGKKNDLLVADEVLEEGERLDELKALSKDDRTFLVACREARDARRNREERKQAQRRKRWYIGGAVALVCACTAVIGIEILRRQAADAMREAADEKAKAAKEKVKVTKDFAERQGNINTAYREYLNAWRTLTDSPAVSIEYAKTARTLFEENNEALPAELQKVLDTAEASKMMQTFGTDKGDAPLCKDRSSRKRHTSAIAEMALVGTKNQRLVTRDINGTVLGWDNALGEKVPSRPCLSIPSVNQMRVTPNGRYLIVGHSYGRICRWKMEDWGDDYPYISSKFHDSAATSLSIAGSEKSSLAVAGFSDGGVWLVDWDKENPPIPVIAEWQIQPPIFAVLFCSDGLQVLTGSGNRKIQFWDIAKASAKTGQSASGSITIEKNVDVTKLVVASDRKLFAAPAGANVLIYRVIPAAPVLRTIPFPKDEVKLEKASTHKVKVVSFGPIVPPRGNHRAAILLFVTWTWNVQDAVIAQGNVNRTLDCLYRLDLTSGEPTKIGSLHPGENKRIAVANFSEAGDRIVAGMDDGSILTWQVDKLNEKPLSRQGYSTSPVTALLINGEWVFTGQADGAVRRWKVPR